MSTFRKILSAAMALVIIINTYAITTMAAFGDGQKLTADINLEVGTYNGTVFTKLAEEKTLKANDIITVRICPKSDFLCGATCYAVMFSNMYFQVIGKDKDAFSANTSNSFYAQVAAEYYGATALKMDKWPTALVQNGSYNDYTAISVNNSSNSIGSPNGGYPGYLPGDWLFSFNLKVVQDINAGSSARIWMDKRWIRTPADTAAYGYFVKCEDENQLSALGSSINYNFDVDLTDANIKLPISNKSTITFNSSGGTDVAPITGVIGSAITAPTNPTKTDYTFMGWSPLLPSTFPAEGFTVTAQWMINKSTITFNSNGGSAVAPITGDIGSPIEAPANPTRANYTFTGWSPSLPSSFPSGGLAVTAQWAPVSSPSIFTKLIQWIVSAFNWLISKLNFGF